MATTPSPSPRVLKLGRFAPPAAVPAAPAAPCGASPAVRLVREGSAVRAIRVDCLCGRTLEIECVVENTAANAADGAR